MSNSDRTEKTLFSVYEELPEHFSLKTKRAESSVGETWDVFDRTKKKKLIYKHFVGPVFENEAAFARFQDDYSVWEQLRQAGASWPGIVAIGKDGKGIWLLREPVVEKSLLEQVSQGKMLREHDAGRRFVSLTDLLGRLHQAGRIHRNLKPSNIFCVGVEDAIFVDPDAGHFRDPVFYPESFDPGTLGSEDFLAPEQRLGSAATAPLDLRTDLWGLAACLAFALTGKTPARLQEEDLPQSFKALIVAALKDDPAERFGTLAEFRSLLEQIVRATRPSAFETPSPAQEVAGTETPAAPAPAPAPAPSPAPAPAPAPAPSPAPAPASATPAASSPSMPAAPPAASVEALPPGIACPQCHAPVRSISDRLCPQCGRVLLEPCLNCQSMNPFWIRQCRGCGSDLLLLKQNLLATLNGQKQQILKLRESYGHDKTLPLLKYMSTVNHPDFVAFKEWAKSMTALIQKERRDIKTYVDNVRMQANAAMEAQKYDKVQQILEQVPRPLLDEPLRKQYVEAGEALTEVDSLIREIRNAISTKQYSQLLSCVQRYLELKANDPEARSLQQKIEKLTTITSPKGIKLRRVPNGRFYMGSHDTDEFLRNNEHPQHRVQIARSLFFGVYPVTQGDFSQLMEFNPSVAVDNENCPVDSVTWFSAVEFCNKMSDLEGLPHFYELQKIKRRSNGSIENADVKTLGGDGYRLPSEAEWEYVCRAGSITPWCYGDQVMEVGEFAWYFDNSGMETHPVGEKKPNAWGLFDMHGNVMEWCHDWYGEFYYQQCPDEEENPTGPDGGTAKVLRGGAWQFGAEATRSAYRNSSSPEAVSSVIGFRVCRNTTDDAM